MARITDLRRTIRKRMAPVATGGTLDPASDRLGFGLTPDTIFKLTR